MNDSYNINFALAGVDIPLRWLSFTPLQASQSGSKSFDGQPQLKNIMQLEYHIDLDERGEFRADVRNESGQTIWSTEGEVFEDGFMRHKNDMGGLADYLSDLGLMRVSDRLINCG